MGGSIVLICPTRLGKNLGIFRGEMYDSAYDESPLQER